VTAYLEQQGYADTFLQAGDGPATTFFLPPAQVSGQSDPIKAHCAPWVGVAGSRLQDGARGLL